ncbi:unnamed protein product [marine sediment metagenome]|uniref:Uncharacterized protein n=1 Tax=marine sediment metagenome TaxID=412755 RepID=X1A2G7_9ZZZZ
MKVKKTLIVQVKIIEKDGKEMIGLATEKEGFAHGLSGNLEIIGLLEHIKKQFELKIARQEAFSK